MTKQTINASLLSEAADVVKQTCDALQDKACEYILDNPLEYYRWQQALENGRMFRAQLQLLAEDLQKQEQASAGEPDEIDLAVKAAFERRMHAHSINVPCEEKDCALCKKRAAEQLGTSPRFAVGDTVRVKHGYSFHRFGGIVGLEGVVKETGITIEAIDPFRNDGLMIYIEFCNPQEQMMYPQDLTLIAKGQA